MSITASEMTPADIAAVTNNGYGGGFGDGFGGGNGWWLILLFLFAFNGGWGNGGFGGGNGGFFPWMFSTQNTNSDVQRGFDQSAVMGGINGIQNAVNNGFSNTATQLCNGFAGVNQTVNAGFANAETAANARQIANMQQAFSSQTAITGGLTNLASQFADCCCENRLATANLANVIQTENCADRAALSDGVRDILTATQAQNQRILDKLCDQELQAERRENDNLRTQLNMANLAASQTAQTSRLLADNAAQTQAIENYVRPQINPAYIVPNPYAYNFYPNNGWGGCCGNSNAVNF